MSKQELEERPTADQTAGTPQIAAQQSEQQETSKPAKKPADGPKKISKKAKNDPQLDLVKRLIEKLSTQLTSDEHAKGTLGDLLKLMQLEKELAPASDEREIIVRWVDPWE